MYSSEKYAIVCLYWKLCTIEQREKRSVNIYFVSQD